MADEWTIGRLLQWTTDYLKQHGADSPRLEAEVLLAHARGCKRVELYTSFDEPADDALRTRFRELVKRRAEGVPFAYLVGHREFYSLDFRVTPDVLIPRPETEFLVIALLDLIKARGQGGNAIEVADVGTGSGIVAVSVARHAPQVRVTAIDVSPQALAVARENAERLGVAERVEFVESDLFAAVPAEQTFDFVASNPPYVTEAEYAALPSDVRQHEPREPWWPARRARRSSSGCCRRRPSSCARADRSCWKSALCYNSPSKSLIAADARWELGETGKDLAGRPRVVQARRNAS